MKNTLVKTILALFICLNMMLSFVALAAIYPFKSGDWIIYTISVSAAGQSVSGSMTITISSVTTTAVSGTMEIDIVGQQQTADFSINVTTGTGTVAGAPATLIIPVNLTQGQSIPGMTGISITSVTDRSYAGASRRCVGLTTNIPGYDMTGTFYWDQATGILLEVSGSMTYEGQTFSYAFIATGTNLWAGTGGLFGIDLWLLVVIAVVAVAVIVGVVLLMRRRKQPVAQPPFPTPPTPPPPPSSG